ncbi:MULTISPECIES: hypothetical protein [Streptomyces]|uniref:hypothetical protein n=1 Tax=Streptomyces TaxID=1883 RepID=UPI000CD511E4|nr:MULTISPECIES: hypothetical protein [Streptomyces]
MTQPLEAPVKEMADAFDLELQQHPIGELSAWPGGGEDGEEGDTTGDGCGESPPQGPTTGC